MKKFLVVSIIFSLVLFMFTAVAFAASSGSIELYATGGSTAEWTTEEAKFGNYSAKLTMPSGTGWVNDNAEVRITISSNPKLSDITNWNFWGKGQDAYFVPVEFYIDTNMDGVYDKIIIGQKMGSMTDEWVELNKGNMSMYMTWKNGYEWLFNWSNVQLKYGDATLLRVDIGYGSLGSNKAITAYIDDFMLNDVTYVLEAPPLAAEIDIAPDTLNLLSKEKWITCYIELEEGYDVSDIDILTILLNDIVIAEFKPTKIGDHDIDGIPDLMVKFNADEVKEIVEVGDEVDIIIKGELTTGELFEGTDTIKVIEPGKK